MTTGGGKAGTAPQPTTSCHECCMCGDYGLSSELFNCKVCHFRSQHRYCSNLYPKAESYRVCNWCLLSQRIDGDGDVDDHDDRTAEKTQNSSNSSSSHREGDHAIIKSKKLKSGGLIENQLGGLKGQKGNLRLQVTSSSPIKKQRLPSPAARKRVVAGGGGGGRVEKEKLRRTKSEGILINGGGAGAGGITKHVFRNKVRRYKLLDEVSSQ